MKIAIEYLPNNELDRKYPYISSDIYVPDHWTDYYIDMWYRERHRNINHCGITVKKITRYEE